MHTYISYIYLKLLQNTHGKMEFKQKKFSVLFDNAYFGSTLEIIFRHGFQNFCTKKRIFLLFPMDSSNYGHILCVWGGVRERESMTLWTHSTMQSPDINQNQKMKEWQSPGRNQNCRWILLRIFDLDCIKFWQAFLYWDEWFPRNVLFGTRYGRLNCDYKSK